MTKKVSSLQQVMSWPPSPEQFQEIASILRRQMMSWIVNHDAKAINSIIVEWACPRCGMVQKSEVYGSDISYLEAECKNEICGNNSKLVLWNAEPEISYKSQSDVPLKEAQ